MCQACGQRRATIHLTDFGEHGPVQTHLCEDCYGQQEGVPFLGHTKQVQQKIVQQLIGAIAPEMAKLTTKECPQCGMDYLEFRHTLRLGCPHDYDAFQEALDELLERMHRGNRHIGKVPHGAAQHGAAGAALGVLERRLEQAVSREDFSTAARLRDRIRSVEEQKRAGETGQ